jgi:hypothetical protein
LVARNISTKSAVAEPPHVSREESARQLFKFICSGQLDPSMYAFIILPLIKYHWLFEFQVAIFFRSIIDFGGYGGSVLDVVQSFGPNKCLENFFMQGFIDCIRDDDILYNPDIIINTLILNVNIGVMFLYFTLQIFIMFQFLVYKYIILINIFFVLTVLNIEELEQQSANPQPFSTSVLKDLIVPIFPPDEVLNQIKLVSPKQYYL